MKKKVLMTVIICALVLTTPMLAFAAFYSIDNDPSSPIYDYVYVVGEPVNRMYYLNEDFGAFNPNGTISSGSLPSGLTISSGVQCVYITGVPTAVTSGAQSATIWARNDANETQTRNITFTINQANTTTAVSANPSPVTIGQTVILTAAVSPVAPSTAVVTVGTVEFFDGAISLGTGTVNGSGVATLNTAFTALGNHNITAVYTDAAGNYITSTSAVTSVTVNKASPTISASNDTAVLGTAKTVTATLADAILASGDSIIFTATCGAVSVPATATANGNVSFNLPAADINALGVGAHAFTISQTGTAGNAGTNNTTVANATFTLTVNAAPSSAKDITAFSIGGVNGTISGTNITVNMPYGTNKTNLTPTITHTGASVSPASGAAQDFTNPVTYTVTAQDGSTQVYTVTVRVQPPPSPLPKTGDGFPLYELLALLGCCLAALGWLGLRMRGGGLIR